jgi:predicted TIM-barrel fold metal-dependent hydrolase
MNTNATQTEAILEPELPIIDPHHHLWDWPAALLANIPTPHHGFSTVILRAMHYLLPELLNDTNSGHNIRATVFMECGSMYRADAADAFKSIGETEFVNGIAAMCASGRYGDIRACAGIVGHVDLIAGAAVSEALEGHLKAGGGRFRGIRHAAGWQDRTPEVHNSHTDPPPHLYRDHAKFREGFAVLGRMGLCFDAWLYHPQIGDLIDLARAFPNQRIVLDHLGGPLGLGWYADKRAEILAQWRRDMAELARAPNVFMKLGGVGMRLNGFAFHRRERPPSSQELADAWRPYIETCIAAFGPERCMFESNFPVDKISGSYATYWNAFKRLAAGASAGEKALLFRDTARRFYRL